MMLLLALLILVMCATKATPTLHDKSVQDGSSLYVECRHNTTNVKSIEWVFRARTSDNRWRETTESDVMARWVDGTPEPDEADGLTVWNKRVGLVNDHTNLLIHAANFTDTGYIECHYDTVQSFPVGTDPPRYIGAVWNVTVTVPPSNITVQGLKETYVEAEVEYTLVCTVGRSRPEVRVRWSINGIIHNETENEVKNVDTQGIKSTTGTLTYRFKKTPLKQSVSCMVSSWVEAGQILDIHNYGTVDVYVRPKVNISASGVLVQGSSLELTCIVSKARPVPLDDSYYWWRDELRLEESSMNLHISTLEHLRDDGRYSCAAYNVVGNSSKTYVLVEVAYAPEGLPSLKINSNIVKVGDPVLLTCDKNNTSARPSFNKYTFYKGTHRLQNSSSRTLIFYSGSVTMSGVFSCVLSNVIGAGPASNVVALQVAGAAFIEEPSTVVMRKIVTRDPSKVISLSAPTPHPENHSLARDSMDTANYSENMSSVLNLTCVASGYNSSITWTRDGRPLESKFYISRDDFISGKFHYNQDRALRQTLYFNHPRADCKHVARAAGKYECHATTRIGGIAEVATRTFVVELKYPPMNRRSSYFTLPTGLLEPLSLPCDVCSNPLPTAYRWSRNGEVLPGEETDRLTFSKIDTAHLGNYTCTVSNDVGSASFVIHVRKERDTVVGALAGSVSGGLGAGAGIAMIVIACVYVSRRAKGLTGKEVKLTPLGLPAQR